MGRRDAYRDPALWEAARALYRSAQDHGSPNDVRLAVNLLALSGVLANRANELVPYLPQFETSRDPAIFPSVTAFDYARDTIAAATEGADPLAAIRLALDRGELPEVRSRLDEVDEAELPPVLHSELKRLRSAVGLGLKLSQNHTVPLTPRDMLDVIGGNGRTFGRVENDAAAFHVSGPMELVFPLGLRNKVVAGSLDCVDCPSIELYWHTRSTRDLICARWVPVRGSVELMRNGIVLKQAKVPLGSLKFRYEYGTATDRLDLEPDTRWEIPADGDEAGGFSIKALPTLHAGTLRVSRLHLESAKPHSAH